jgi:hypothetical protein
MMSVQFLYGFWTGMIFSIILFVIFWVVSIIAHRKR